MSDFDPRDPISFIRRGVEREVERMKQDLGPAARARLDASAKAVLGFMPGAPRAIAFIPARSGSKRIPGKNLAEVGGLSLTSRAIGCALEALGHDAEVVVSTDDPAIAAGAEAARCTVHHRPAELATDHAQIEDSIADWLTVEAMHGRTMDPRDVLVLLQPTSPFRRASTVRRCVETAMRTMLPCMTVREDGHDPVFAGTRGERGQVRWWRDLTEARPRSQDLADIVVEDGSVYAFSVGHFRWAKSRMGHACTVIPTDRWESLEIDTPRDLEAARALAPWLLGE